MYEWVCRSHENKKVKIDQTRCVSRLVCSHLFAFVIQTFGLLMHFLWGFNLSCCIESNVACGLSVGCIFICIGRGIAVNKSCLRYPFRKKNSHCIYMWRTDKLTAPECRQFCETSHGNEGMNQLSLENTSGQRITGCSLHLLDPEKLSQAHEV